MLVPAGAGPRTSHFRTHKHAHKSHTHAFRPCFLRNCAHGQKPLKSLSSAFVRDVRVHSRMRFVGVSRDHHLLAPPLLLGEKRDQERRDGSRVKQENPCGIKRSGESPSP